MWASREAHALAVDAEALTTSVWRSEDTNGKQPRRCREGLPQKLGALCSKILRGVNERERNLEHSVRLEPARAEVALLDSDAALPAVRRSLRSCRPLPRRARPRGDPSSYDQLFDQVGDDGSVSMDTALQAFALAIAPLPGVTPPAGHRRADRRTDGRHLRDRLADALHRPDHSRPEGRSNCCAHAVPATLSRFNRRARRRRGASFWTADVPTKQDYKDQIDFVEPLIAAKLAAVCIRQSRFRSTTSKPSPRASRALPNRSPACCRSRCRLPSTARLGTCSTWHRGQARCRVPCGLRERRRPARLAGNSARIAPAWPTSNWLTFTPRMCQ